jgi:predicted aminopeptidase
MLPDGRRHSLVRRLLLSLLLCSALPGCAIGYLTQAAQGQWQVLRERQPIARVIADPNTPAALKARLRLVEDARDFAVSELALPDNRSYRSYSDLRRPYVVWNVVAAPEFSIRPLRWCFPFTGCVSYRGYFHERAARAFAAGLAARGNDVLVAGISAYSTLGHFTDPVLNTMLSYGDLDLVATIFHELTHQLLFVPGDSEFDESFAMTVEQEGLRRWLAARGRSQELEDYRARERAEQAITAAFVSARGQLAQLYAMTLPAAQMRRRKQEIMQQCAEQVRALQRQYKVDGYDDWLAAGLNNADLATVATYFDCVPGFQRLLQANGGDLPAFYAAVRSLRHDAAGRRALCRAPGPQAEG